MGSSRVSNFSDLIQRATANCLLHPLGSNRFQLNSSGEEEEEGGSEEEYESGGEDVLREGGLGEEEIDRKENGNDKLNSNNNNTWDLKKGGNAIGGGGEKEVEELVALMSRVFDSVSTIKRVYAELQAAHSPWDPARMRAADEAMVSELRRIGVLRERFKRRTRGFKVEKVPAAETLREVVAPYEAAVEEMRKEVKAKEEEMDMLKQRLNRLSTSTTTSVGRNGVGGGRGHQSKSKRKAAATIIQAQGPLSPSPELFESTVNQVRKATKSFSSLLLSLMRSARWDISAAVRSIVAAASPQTPAAAAEIGGTSGQPHHARYALESYVTGKLFQGFDHESFYMDGTLQSLLDPANFRRDCFSKYRDMRSMDPTELLGVTPTCHFGAFCAKKYLAILHPKMEGSLLGDLDHRNRVSAGDHPRTDFYAHFLAAAKAVWLLHLLAFALDPVPGLFEAAPGADFSPEYMDSVVRLPAAGNILLPALVVVGLPVSPGFKLGNGSVIKARVFLVSRS